MPLLCKMTGKGVFLRHLGELISRRATASGESNTHNFCSSEALWGGWWEVGPHVGGWPCSPGARSVPSSVLGTWDWLPTMPMPSHWLPLCFSLQHIPTFVHIASKLLFPHSDFFRNSCLSHVKSNAIQYLLTACYVRGLVLLTSDDRNKRKREVFPWSPRLMWGGSRD